MNLPNYMNEEAIAMDVFGALDESFRKTDYPDQLLQRLKEVIKQKEKELNDHMWQIFDRLENKIEAKIGTQTQISINGDILEKVDNGEITENEAVDQSIEWMEYCGMIDYDQTEDEKKN